MTVKDNATVEAKVITEEQNETSTAEVKSEKTTSGFNASRVLKETSPIMYGKDVKALQKALIKAGYGCGKDGADGKLGHYTMLAIRALQGDKRLTVNGIAGQKTVEALGGNWKG